MEKITLYKIKGCGLCNMALTQLQAKKVDFDIIEGETEIKKLGFDTAPALKVGDEVYHGKELFKKIMSLGKK